MPRDHTLGVIGVGSMGAALVRGIAAAGAVPPHQIIVSDPAPGRAEQLARDTGAHAAPDNVALARACEYVAVVVKPHLVGAVLREIEPALSNDQTVISFAAGVPLRSLSQTLTRVTPHLLRVMPNTPALVGAGAFALAALEAAPEKVEAVRRLLSSIGRVVSVEDSHMDAATAIGGSGPAFVFVMIEALADGGVAAGLPRAVALELAAQTVLGSAKMVLDTGKHPGQLKDMVTTPAGTTVAGLEALEEAGVRAAFLRAVRAAAKRSRELSEGK